MALHLPLKYSVLSLIPGTGGGGGNSGDCATRHSSGYFPAFRAITVRPSHENWAWARYPLPSRYLSLDDVSSVCPSEHYFQRYVVDFFCPL